VPTMKKQAVVLLFAALLSVSMAVTSKRNFSVIESGGNPVLKSFKSIAEYTYQELSYRLYSNAPLKDICVRSVKYFWHFIIIFIIIKLNSYQESIE
jgi:hypothetical protein